MIYGLSLLLLNHIWLRFRIFARWYITFSLFPIDAWSVAQSFFFFKNGNDWALRWKLTNADALSFVIIFILVVQLFTSRIIVANIRNISYKNKLKKDVSKLYLSIKSWIKFYVKFDHSVVPSSVYYKSLVNEKETKQFVAHFQKYIRISLFELINDSANYYKVNYC